MDTEVPSLMIMLSCSVVSDSLQPHGLCVACQAAMGFLRQECWAWLPFLSPGDLPNPGIRHVFYVSCFGRQIHYHWATWKCLLPSPQILKIVIYTYSNLLPLGNIYIYIHTHTHIYICVCIYKIILTETNNCKLCQPQLLGELIDYCKIQLRDHLLSFLGAVWFSDYVLAGEI